MPEVIESMYQKIIRRNQHVFGDLMLVDIDAVNQHWRSIKEHESAQQVKRTSFKMYDISIKQGEVLVTIQDHPVLTIPLEPPPAKNYTLGYTQSAWIWLALNDVLEHANVCMQDEDIKELAILITKQVQMN